MEHGMTLTLRDSAHVVSDPENLTSSVHEVFEMMLGVACDVGLPSDSPDVIGGAESVTAVVGFGGILSGACVITVDEGSARQIAFRMTGMGLELLDDVVKEAIGEICNRLAEPGKARCLTWPPIAGCRCRL